MGARANTFNTPGVVEHAHFLKEVDDEQRIRRRVLDCFERASLPSISEDKRKIILHFVVVGGGPAGLTKELQRLLKKSSQGIESTLKLDQWLRKAKEGDDVLDLCCGSGDLAFLV
ncbi:unnamed protein product [Fraxinus pennsylvanica]|uniref:NADH:ubiquinone reductase (non-electrogenic) n=1 Tax=Fraxinus pennsylvanica TaxID=56036 RepID=A0AAD1ZQX4_9LAMI|nr:unnamed protein product [Fraxinus pennsylvanica]